MNISILGRKICLSINNPVCLIHPQQVGFRSPNTLSPKILLLKPWVNRNIVLEISMVEEACTTRSGNTHLVYVGIDILFVEYCSWICHSKTIENVVTWFQKTKLYENIEKITSKKSFFKRDRISWNTVSFLCFTIYIIMYVIHK